MTSKKTTIEISHRTIIFTVLFLIGMYALYQIADIVLMLFVAVLITAALNPFVTKLEKKKIPRAASIAIVFTCFYGVIIAAIAAIAPPLISQSITLFSQVKLPTDIINNFNLSNFNLEHLQLIANQFTSVPKIIGFISSAFSNLIVIVTLSVVSIYMLLERKNLHKYLVWFFGSQTAESNAEKFVDSFEVQVGSWVRGQALLMFAVGLLTYIGLTILGISFALPLAILAGFLEILPNIGPTLAAIPAIIIAFVTVSPAMALAVLALYIIIQQLENNLIMPYAMRKAANINPIITIVVILIGFRLGGVVGAALAIPLFLVVKIIFMEWYSRRPHPKTKKAKKVSSKTA